MKLENDHMLSIQSPPRKSYNPFDSDDEDTNDYLKSNLNGYDIKSLETNAKSLTFHLDSSDLSWEEAILGHSPASTCVIPANSDGKEALFRKDTELFTDKTVSECELPELLVCYKENAYHSIKDIGIDEGVWTKGRDNHGGKNLSAFPDLNGDANGDLPHREEHQELPFMEGLRCRSDNDSEKSEDLTKDSGLDHEASERQSFSEKCGTHDSTKRDEFKHDSSEKDKEFNSSCESTGDPIKNGGVFSGTRDPQSCETEEVNYHDSSKKEPNSSCQSMADLIKTGGGIYDTGDPQLSATDDVNHHEVEKKGSNSEEEHGKVDAPLEHTEESSTRPPCANGAEGSTVSSESRIEEASSPQSIELPASQEPAGVGVANSLSYNSKVESGSIILDFNSSTTISGKEKEKSQDTEAAVGKPPETQTMSRHDDMPRGGSILDSNTAKRIYGETSFSAAMPPPASIMYMGPCTRSGSISLRSESSAGSTRSFAFPVLQGEWNSSPVRMAKPDHRHFRKHRGWAHSLMCCKF